MADCVTTQPGKGSETHISQDPSSYLFGAVKELHSILEASLCALGHPGKAGSSLAPPTLFFPTEFLKFTSLPLPGLPGSCSAVPPSAHLLSLRLTTHQHRTQDTVPG